MPAKLQILIVTKGEKGIKRIAALSHPRVKDVEYIVSWQEASMDDIPEELKSRDDFKIYPSSGVGISNNRNDAFSHATAPFLLLSDDDLSYTPQNIDNVLKGFESHPEASFLTFRYASETNPKQYPDTEVDLTRKLPKGYHVSSVEIGFNLNAMRIIDRDLKELKFNPNFGINGRIFNSGEENIMLTRLIRSGHKGLFLPVTIVTHEGPTTGMRDKFKESHITAKGACLLYMKPSTWFLRMLTHAWRSHKRKGEGHIGFFRYCQWWMRGVRLAKKEKAFADM